MRVSQLKRKVEEDNVDYYEEIYTKKVVDLTRKTRMAENKNYIGNLIRGYAY